jgi:hypothetical protein
MTRPMRRVMTGLFVPTRRRLALGDMVLAVITRPMPRATMAWYVRRLCSHVSGRMAHAVMTLPEPRVQQVSCDLAQGGEPLTLAAWRRPYEGWPALQSREKRLD